DERLAGTLGEHQRRIGHRPGRPAEPWCRFPRLAQLLDGHQRHAATAHHPQPRPRWARSGTDSLSGRTGLRGSTVWAGRNTALPTTSGPSAAGTDAAGRFAGGRTATTVTMTTTRGLEP